MNLDALAETMTDMEEELSSDLMKFATAALTTTVPSRAVDAAAIGVLMIAAGRLHARIMREKHDSPPQDSRAHIAGCESCLEKVVQIMADFRISDEVTLKGNIQTFFEQGIRIELIASK